MCGVLRWASNAARLSHFSTIVTTFARAEARSQGTSIMGVYSMHPFSARTWGTSFSNTASRSSRLPALVSIVAMTQIIGWFSVVFLCSP